MFTSLKLSKLLKENGFKRKSEISWTENKLIKNIKVAGKISPLVKIPAFDILNDLCVRYATILFGEEKVEMDEYKIIMPKKMIVLFVVGTFLQAGKKDEAEEYLWKHCKFNPKNK